MNLLSLVSGSSVSRQVYVFHNALVLASDIIMEDDSSDDEAPMLVDMSSSSAPPQGAESDGQEEVGVNQGFDKGGVDKEDGNEDRTSLPVCPVTILSGFLGSGKTTLIQYILKDPHHGKRIAVIENEYGEGLSVENIIARDGVDPQSDSLQEFIELPNGCICCTVKDSLVEALENLIARKKDLDYILIEASGMADPGPIASVFWLDDALESRLRLDGIVTIVDAVHILQQLETTEEAARQIVYSDRLIVNKVDLLHGRQNKEEQLEQVLKTLRRLHPSAPFRMTTYSQIPDLDWILNAHCFGGSARFDELDSLWNTWTLTPKKGGLFPHEDHSIDDGGSDDDNDKKKTQQDHHHDDHHHHHHHHDHEDDHHDRHHHHHHHDHDHDHHGEHDDCEECHVHTPQEQQQQHKHTDAVTTLAFRYKGSLSLPRLNKWMAEILWPHQDETNIFLMSLLHDPSKKEEFLQNQKNIMQIFRIKGVVSVIHDPNEALDSIENDDNYMIPRKGSQQLLSDRRRYIVQAVHDLWEVHPASDNLCFDTNEERMGKVVIIGKYLPAKELEKGFQACFLDM